MSTSTYRSTGKGCRRKREVNYAVMRRPVEFLAGVTQVAANGGRSGGNKFVIK
jgi:hypothetical protein